MRRKNHWLAVIFPALGMLVLILDSGTALQGAAEGIELCVRTVIPALLPFFVLSTLLTSAIGGKELPFLRTIAELTHLPRGSEGILLIGLLGGYPVGAQSVVQLWREGKLSKKTAQRMLGFCSNAGPAFIFGMTAQLFTNPAAPWLLWIIHIHSALFVGWILPGERTEECPYTETKRLDLSTAVMTSVRIMAGVCGWIVLMRVFLAFLDRWFLWLLPGTWALAVSGLLELANGCARLHEVASEPLRFTLCAVFLGFGGVCVGMQTVSVTKGLGTGLYFPGKVLQALGSILLALPVSILLYHGNKMLAIPSLLLCIAVPVAAKKTVAFSGGLVYNKKKC